jgi:hypothetical protein
MVQSSILGLDKARKLKLLYTQFLIRHQRGFTAVKLQLIVKLRSTRANFGRVERCESS